jgi:hypothetical protein
MDDGDNEPHDTVAMGRAPLLAALSSHMSDLPGNVGPGAVELADGLKAAICAEPSLRTGAEALLDDRQLPWPADLDGAPCNKTLRAMLPMAVDAAGDELLIEVEGTVMIRVGSIAAPGTLTELTRRMCTGPCRVRRPGGDGWWVKAERDGELAWASALSAPGREKMIGSSTLMPAVSSKTGVVRAFRR